MLLRIVNLVASMFLMSCTKTFILPKNPDEKNKVVSEVINGYVKTSINNYQLPPHTLSSRDRKRTVITDFEGNLGTTILAGERSPIFQIAGKDGDALYAPYYKIIKDESWVVARPISRLRYLWLSQKAR